jgi:hypothetical protein
MRIQVLHALIPAFSPGEKENRLSGSIEFEAGSMSVAIPMDERRTKLIPSPGGEGKGEGELHLI